MKRLNQVAFRKMARIEPFFRLYKIQVMTTWNALHAGQKLAKLFFEHGLVEKEEILIDLKINLTKYEHIAT